MPKLLPAFLLLATAIAASCKKEPSVSTAIAPLAKAGADTTVVLPADSATLDGFASYDPDGQIVAYTWAQISGPAPAELLSPQNIKTKARRLQLGAYAFRLTVKDNSGLLSSDTVIVSVRLLATARIQANAGPDQVIDLVIGYAALDGTASKDSSGLPLNHQWKQIAGPSAQITNQNSAQTIAVLPAVAHYRFELKAWNANGESYDTMQVIVQDSRNCAAGRTEYRARLDHLADLPLTTPYGFSRLMVAGSKLVIPYEWDYTTGKPSDIVFLYDVLNGTIIQKQLSVARAGYAIAAAGNKLFFAGGFTGFVDDERPSVTDTVDIYDVVTNTWSTARLSEARGALKAGVAGNKLVFAGGLKSNVLSNKVDIYDLQTGQWTTSVMAGEPRAVERVLADDEGKIYFLAGYTAWENVTGFGFVLTGASKTIDIYHAGSNTWSTENMQVARYGFAAAKVNDKIIIAGGMTVANSYENLTANVEVIQLPSMLRSNTCLATATAWYYADAVTVKNGSIIFYLGTGPEKRKFNIYNPQTDVWSLGVHDFDVLGQDEAASLATVNNQVFVLKGSSLFKLEY